MLDIRRRTGALFGAVLVGHVVLISAQMNTARGVPVIEAASVGVVGEAQRATAGLIDGLRGAWGGYIALRDVEQENARLARENAELQVRLQEERALARQARGLERLLGLQRRLSIETAAAGIIAGAASPDFATVTIDKGTAAGLAGDMAVVAPSGVVGRVVRPTARTSTVQLLIDRNAAAGAMLEASRVQGVVVGTGDGGLRLDFVPPTTEVVVGDLVVTSGIDGIYPKGFILGQIESVERRGEDWGEIRVRPAVDFSALEAVLVVTGVADSAGAPH
jgi:rod shape-determining protein MreC